MKRIVRIIAAAATILMVAGCKQLAPKHADQGQVDRLMDKLENSNPT